MIVSCSNILFDMDGVLVDSRANVRRRWKMWAQDHDLDPADVVPMTDGFSTQQIIETFLTGRKAEAEIERMDLGAEQDLDGVKVMPGAGCLHDLPAATWGVVTSASRKTALARLTYVDLPVPDVLVSSDDVNNLKPSPEPYLRGIDHMNAQPAEILVFEDSVPGVESALRARLRVVAVGDDHVESESGQTVSRIQALADAEISYDGSTFEIVLPH